MDLVLRRIGITDQKNAGSIAAAGQIRSACHTDAEGMSADKFRNAGPLPVVADRSHEFVIPHAARLRHTPDPMGHEGMCTVEVRQPVVPEAAILIDGDSAVDRVLSS